MAIKKKTIENLIENNVLSNNNKTKGKTKKDKKDVEKKLSKKLLSSINYPGTNNSTSEAKVENTPNDPSKEEQVFIIGKVKKSYLKESEIVKALELNCGVISDTAKMLRTSYARLKDFIESNPSLKQATEELQEVKKDLAESELNKHIRKGNLTAIIFFLKTKAKDRGYVESMDLNLPNKPIYFVYKEVAPEVKK